jgi:hypothetical protein
MATHHLFLAADFFNNEEAEMALREVFQIQ